MKKNGFVKRLLFPPLAVILLLIAVSAATLIRIFLHGLEMTIPACVCYVISFYTLCVSCVFCRKTLPRYWRSGRNRLYANRYANRYLTDTAYKTHVNLYRALLIDVGTNALSSYVYHTRCFPCFCWRRPCFPALAPICPANTDRS